MKIKLNIKSIIFMAIIAMASLLFINISFAANTTKQKNTAETDCTQTSTSASEVV